MDKKASFINPVDKKPQLFVGRGYNHADKATIFCPAESEKTGRIFASMQPVSRRRCIGGVMTPPYESTIGAHRQKTAALYGAAAILLLLFLFFQMLFQDKIDVLRQRTVIILCFSFDLFENITVNGDTDFLL